MKIIESIGVQKICFNYVFRRGNGQNYISDNNYSFEYLSKLVEKFSEKVKNTIIYHNYNYDGQCLLLRNNGSIWAVPSLVLRLI